MVQGLRTIQDIYDRVVRLFGDEAGIQITSDDVIMWTLDGMSTIAAELEDAKPFQWSADIDLVAGTRAYAILGLAGFDFKSHEHLLEVGVRQDSVSTSFYRLKFMTPKELDELIPGWTGSDQSQGQPLYWTYHNDGLNNIVLYPTPDNAIVDGLRIAFTLDRTLGDNSVYVATLAMEIHKFIPQYLTQAVLDFVLYRCYEQDEDWQAADRKLASFEKKVRSAYGKEAWIDRSEYPHIHTKVEDYNNG